MSSKTTSSSKALNRNLEAKLAAFDDDESSDDEAQDENVEGSSSLSFLKNDETKIVSKKVKTDASSVIYLGHLPVAFEEYELRGFLSQFGDITNLRVARSKKTSNTKGYAFVEFEDAEVASIVAETMGGYLLLEKRLVCHLIPPEKVHPRMFHGGNHWKNIDWRKKHRNQVNQPRSAAKLSKITQRLQSREKKKRQKLKELGIDYDFPGYSAATSTTTKKEEEEDAAQKEEEAKEKIEKKEETPKSSSSTKKRRKLSHDDGEKETKSSSKKKKKKRKDSNADDDEETSKSEKETLKKKKRKDSNADEEETSKSEKETLKKKKRKDANADDEETDKSEKETKPSLKKKKRKDSNASHEDTITTTTPDTKGDSLEKSQTDLKKKKKKKKKADKKRRVSAP